MTALRWFPANYQGFGVQESRVYVTPLGQALAILAEDIDRERADPIVMACGLRPAGNGGQCWLVAPLMEDREAAPPFPNACFASIEQVEDYLVEWTLDDPAAMPTDPIGEDEFFEFCRQLDEDFELPRA